MGHGGYLVYTRSKFRARKENIFSSRMYYVMSLSSWLHGASKFMEGSTRTNLCNELLFALNSKHFHALVYFMALARHARLNVFCLS
jgi:hypothetical protein